MTCPTGGGHVRWHNATRDFLARWVGGLTDAPGGVAPTEQVVPQWYDDVKQEAGRLDIGPFKDPQGRLCYIDVVFGTATALPGSADARAFGARDGAKAEAMEAAKRSMYPPHEHPAAHLVPFAVEAHGRWGADAASFVANMVPQNHPDRAREIARCRRAVSVLAMGRLGDLLVSSEAA